MILCRTIFISRRRRLEKDPIKNPLWSIFSQSGAELRAGVVQPARDYQPLTRAPPMKNIIFIISIRIIVIIKMRHLKVCEHRSCLTWLARVAGQCLSGQMGSLWCHFLPANMRVQPVGRPGSPVNTTLNFPGYRGGQNITQPVYRTRLVI